MCINHENIYHIIIFSIYLPIKLLWFFLIVVISQQVGQNSIIKYSSKGIFTVFYKDFHFTLNKLEK